MPRKDNTERNRAIIAELAAGQLSRKDVAAKHHLSYAHTFRIEKNDSNGNSPDTYQAPQSGGGMFSEIATTGLRHYGGRIDEEYDRRFKSLNKRIQLYREMGDDPLVAAVLQAIKMTLRRVPWFFNKAGETPADQEATDFAETVIQDMSQSWSDTIDQSLGMIQYGFYPAEIVYKKRNGEQKKAGSKYDDGRIGWRKWTFVAPETLSPGDEWSFDEKGGLQGFNQQPPSGPSTVVHIPIDKAILFRTTAEKGNPEGRSILRAMYPAWYYKKNLEEIEAISAERMGAGLPVIYAGSDVSKGTSSEFDELKKIGRNVRVDEQMGVAIPFAKMGQGAKEGQGVLFELVSPPSRGVIHFHETITRYEQRMTMVGLAQFIHLGMQKIGTQALAESSTDFFTLALTGWLDMLRDTIQRFGVERLFRLNHFPGITAYPQLAHESLIRFPLAEMGTYINNLAGAALVTPSLELENYLRSLAGIPERTEPVQVDSELKPETDESKPELPEKEGDLEPETATIVPDAVAGSPDRFFSPDQPRADKGKFAPGGGGDESGGGGGGGSGGDPAPGKKLYDDEIGDFGESQSGEVIDGLSSDQRKTLLAYQKTEHGDINDALREEGPLSPKIKKQTDNMDAALDKATLTEDATVYRGLAQDTLPAGNMEGAVLTDRGYISTSASAKVAKSFSTDEGAFVEIRLKPGDKALFMDSLSNRGEFEFLLPRDTSFLVRSDTRLPSGKRKLILEVAGG